MVRLVSLCLLVFCATVSSGAPRHFEVVASLVLAGGAGSDGAVAVSFRALDPDLQLNESPAPRLRLDLAQTVLLDRQPPAKGDVPDYDPLTARYLDLARPVLFPVALSPTAPKGQQAVKATVVYFYCSKREAWCRRGTAEVEIPVTVR